MPCNQIAIDDNHVRVLLTLNILRPRLYQSHLWEPRRILGHSEVGHFGRRESSHTFAGERPRSIIGSPKCFLTPALASQQNNGRFLPLHKGITHHCLWCGQRDEQ